MNDTNERSCAARGSGSAERKRYTPLPFSCPQCGKTVNTWTHVEECRGEDK